MVEQGKSNTLLIYGVEPVINIEDRVEFAVTPMLFGKWSYEGVQCS